MDNRLTKKRLSDFLAYEWILTIIVAVAAIFVWELVYTVAATRLSTGQQFKFYFDETVYMSDSSDKSVYDLLGVNLGENGKTFSFDVLSVETENLTASYNVLSVRLSVQEGDAIFTSSVAEEGQDIRAKQIIDSSSVYDLDALINGENGAKAYLAKFVISGGDIYNDVDYDENAIKAYFDARMAGDKRFRTDAEKEEGRKNEIGRIKKLAKDVKDFETLLSVGEEKGLFYRYTKYEQSASAENADENVVKAHEKEIENGKTDRIYGLNMAALTGGNKNVSDYLKLSGKGNSEGVVLMLFDFSEYQPDLQFEGISFTMTLVREFSDILG